MKVTNRPKTKFAIKETIFTTLKMIVEAIAIVPNYKSILATIKNPKTIYYMSLSNKMKLLT